MAKSPDAFRTISEVADWLGVQAHVLRFWESKFAQVKPIKRAGGRRYYRPTDMLLIGGIKKLLHEDGLTIKGVQKLLRENGTGFVADQSQPLDDLTIAVIEGTAEDAEESTALQDAVAPEVAADTAPEVVAPETEDADTAPEAPPAEPIPPEPDIAEPLDLHEEQQDPTPEQVESARHEDAAQAEPAQADQEPAQDEREPAPIEEPLLAEPSEPDVPVADAAPDHAGNNDTQPEPESEPEPQASAPEQEHATDAPAIPTFRARTRDEPAQDTPEENTTETAPDAAPSDDQNGAEEDDGKPFSVTPPEPTDAPAKKPRIIDVGPLPELADFNANPSALSALATLDSITPQEAEAIRPLIARLTRLRASMASPRKDIGKD